MNGLVVGGRYYVYGQGTEFFGVLMSMNEQEWVFSLGGESVRIWGSGWTAERAEYQ